MTDYRRFARDVALALLTPLLEKNVIKTFAADLPLVFSMSRLIVLAFAVGMLRQIWHAGIAGWPDATVAIAIVLALPTLGALERATPEQVLNIAKTLLGRAGAGGVRGIASAYGATGSEPSKFDDHRND